MHPDYKIRLEAFNWLEKQLLIHGEVLPRKILEQGFDFEGVRIPLVSPQGIFKPRICELPLTITTTADGPYDDSFNDNGQLLYKYRGTDPQHRDNVGLRTACNLNVPLIYLHGVVPGKYIAEWPTFIVGDDPSNLTFTLSVDDHKQIYNKEFQFESNPINDGRRAYITATVKQRLHQHAFRERVLAAYKSQCALCRLRHPELLDAAHIIPDSDPMGKPTTDNGLSLCKIHHAAFDKLFLGITPDYEIHIRENILQESDGPMLKHGLKELHKVKIILPKKIADQPRKEFLEVRYKQFVVGAA